MNASIMLLTFLIELTLVQYFVLFLNCEISNKFTGDTGELLLIDDPSNNTVMVNLDNNSIDGCFIPRGCQYLANVRNDSSFQELTPIAVQQGINIQIISANLSSMTVCRASLENNDLVCRNASADALQHEEKKQDGAYLLPEELLHPGFNIYVCYGRDGCKNSLEDSYRLNITVKTNSCISDKDRNLCSGNGRCSSLSEERVFSCKCVDSFSGDTCQIKREEDPQTMSCTEYNCLNGGTCVIISHNNNTVSRACVCPKYVTGLDCEVILNQCKSSPCKNGVCVDKAEGYQCYCVPGFHGRQCELEYNECLSNPCQNLGKCVDRIDKFECRCPHGFAGSNCEKKLDLCKLNPCHSNATCINVVAGDQEESFHCLCPSGLTGTLCDTKLMSCYSNPCRNRGTCTEITGGYHCSCPVMFAGVDCEYMLDIFAPPMEGADMNGEIHKHNLYIVAGTLGSMILIVVSVIVACYCKIYETYKQLVWKNIRYQRKRSNSCPDLETCNDTTYHGKHRLSADAILEATSLVHDNAAFDNYNSHQALNSLQI